MSKGMLRCQGASGPPLAASVLWTQTWASWGQGYLFISLTAVYPRVYNSAHGRCQIHVYWIWVNERTDPPHSIRFRRSHLSSSKKRVLGCLGLESGAPLLGAQPKALPQSPSVCIHLSRLRSSNRTWLLFLHPIPGLLSPAVLSSWPHPGITLRTFWIITSIQDKLNRFLRVGQQFKIFSNDWF